MLLDALELQKDKPVMGPNRELEDALELVEDNPAMELNLE